MGVTKFNMKVCCFIYEIQFNLNKINVLDEDLVRTFTNVKIILQ